MSENKCPVSNAKYIFKQKHQTKVVMSSDFESTCQSEVLTFWYHGAEAEAKVVSKSWSFKKAEPKALAKKTSASWSRIWSCLHPCLQHVCVLNILVWCEIGTMSASVIKLPTTCSNLHRVFFSLLFYSNIVCAARIHHNLGGWAHFYVFPIHVKNNF